MNISFPQNWKIYLFSILFLLCLFISYMYIFPSQKNYDKSLVLLSEQFLKWKISYPISDELPIADIADYKYNFYSYFGPFPSIFLMPFVALFGRVPQYILGIFSMSICFITAYSLSKKFKFSRIDSLWLSLFFVFSTVLFSSSVMNISAFQVEAFGVPFVLLALNEYFGRKRGFLIGIFLSLAILTRVTLLFAFSFFLIEFLQKRLDRKHFVVILIPFFISLILLASYNDRRFHSIFETGYSYNRILGAFPLSENLKHGVVSVSHIPANLYNFLVKSPEPLMDGKYGFHLKFPYLTASPWGMAIWWTSPLFLLLIFRFRKSRYTLSAASAAILLSLPVITYYSIGFVQFGYRYALDFLPFLFLILLPCLSPRLSKTAIILITAGVLFNLLYSNSLFGVYPLPGFF